MNKNLELQVKVKTLFIFMLYGFLNITAARQPDNNNNPIYPRLIDHLGQMQSKFEKKNSYGQIKDNMPLLNFN